MKRITFMALAMALTLLAASCKKKDTTDTAGTGAMTLEFDHVVGTQALQFGTQTYTNANGDDYRVNTFKYYVSNLKLVKSDGSETILPETYLLVNAADASSRFQVVDNIPAGDYTGLELIIGVDEPRNFAGAQTGALDPARGMFWSWNSGYIFLMFEGTSSKSTQASNRLFYHVGGAKAPNNAVRTVSLDFPTTLRIRENSKPDVHFFVDLSALFKGKNVMNFATVSGFHGGANAVLVADNYVNGLFRIDHIHN